MFTLAVKFEKVEIETFTELVMKEVEEKILTHNKINSANVMKKYPNSIIIEIEEI